MKSLGVTALLVLSAAIVGGQGDEQKVRLQQRLQRGGAHIMQYQYPPSNEISRLELRIQQLEDTVRNLQQRIETLERKAATPEPRPMK